jgi:hypothetical protein
MSRFPPRLHVLLASHAPVGLVIRRGPSKSVATILWDRQRDEFQLGQWLKGRIYERRSDLSPDGRHFIYFAVNGKQNSPTGGAWTAISRAPFLKALALLAKGDCWNGGGLWTGKSTYWLNDGYGHTVLHNTKDVRRNRWYRPRKDYGGECLGVYYPRLVRDGWTLVKREKLGNWKHEDIFEKPIGQGWILRKIAHAECDAPAGNGCYWDEHELVHATTGDCIACPKCGWADLDGKRLVWTTDGTLNSGQIGKDGLSHRTELFDFSSLAFTPIKAPY